MNIVIQGEHYTDPADVLADYDGFWDFWEKAQACGLPLHTAAILWAASDEAGVNCDEVVPLADGLEAGVENAGERQEQMRYREPVLHGAPS